MDYAYNADPNSKATNSKPSPQITKMPTKSTPKSKTTQKQKAKPRVQKPKSIVSKKSNAPVLKTLKEPTPKKSTNKPKKSPAPKSTNKTKKSPLPKSTKKTKKVPPPKSTKKTPPPKRTKKPFPTKKHNTRRSFLDEVNALEDHPRQKNSAAENEKKLDEFLDRLDSD